MKILLIGSQGSGKSTQASILATQLNLSKIAVGDIYRQLAKEDTDLGRGIKEILDKGQLVDDATTARIVEERLNREDCKNGFVLDGYPRTLEQARLFDPGFDKVFYLKLKQAIAIERLLKRGRADDTKELIEKRLELYYQQTQPLLDYYKDEGILVEIDALGDIKSIQNEIKKFL